MVITINKTKEKITLNQVWKNFYQKQNIIHNVQIVRMFMFLCTSFFRSADHLQMIASAKVCYQINVLWFR